MSISPLKEWPFLVPTVRSGNEMIIYYVAGLHFRPGRYFTPSGKRILQEVAFGFSPALLRLLVPLFFLIQNLDFRPAIPAVRKRSILETPLGGW